MIEPLSTKYVDIWKHMPSEIISEFEDMCDGGSDYPHVITPLGFVYEYSLAQQEQLLPYVLSVFGRSFYEEVMQLREMSAVELTKLSQSNPLRKSFYNQP